MWGAGLIKLRGDPCWRDLTCLDFHFETQPIPSPLTPRSTSCRTGRTSCGVLFNHVVELARAVLRVRPAARCAIVGGALMAALQLVLIASGNLVVPQLADAGADPRLLRRRRCGGACCRGALVARAERARAGGDPVARAGRGRRGRWASRSRCSASAPVVNMLSGKQMMNTSFTRLPLVNTYGAFGSVGRERDAAGVRGDDRRGRSRPRRRWRAYELKCQPGDPARRPCWMSPYHYRLDWLLWFAAMGAPRDYPWAVHLVVEAAGGRSGGAGAARDAIRSAARRRATSASSSTAIVSRRAARRVWWTRERVAAWLPPRLARQRGAADLSAPAGLVARDR